jgi:ABC-type thiamine transport system substrate-binding protein
MCRDWIGMRFRVMGEREYLREVSPPPTLIPYGHSYYTFVYNRGNFKQILKTVKSLNALLYKGINGVGKKK